MGKIKGYGGGKVSQIVSFDEIEKEAKKISRDAPSVAKLRELAGDNITLEINDLKAGYGKMEILHHVNLFASRGKATCLIGPNGAGKSTILHSIFGFADVFSGDIVVDKKNINSLPPNEKLTKSKIAYILQDNSIFPKMTVEENLFLGGFLNPQEKEVVAKVEEIFNKYDRLRKRRSQPASTLSGGERRLLEIARSLIMNPEIILIDEPSIGLEPRFIDMVFEILDDLRTNEKKTIIMVEQNAKKGLSFSDVGYVLVSGTVAMADTGKSLLKNSKVGRLFLGG